MANKKNLGLKKRLTDADEEGRQILIDGLPYQVGFAKPPRGTRFKAGNRYGRGRSKGSKNLSTIIKEEFDDEIEVTENGRACKMAKKRIMVRQLANKGAAGDLKAAVVGFDLMRRAGEFNEEVASQAPVFDERDHESFRELVAILTPKASPTADGDEGQS
jgi:hypothetical protein